MPTKSRTSPSGKKALLALLLILSLLVGYLTPAIPTRAAGQAGAPAQDKSAAVTNLRAAATQDEQPVDDQTKLDLQKSFKLKFAFSYKILKDEFIPDYAAAGVTAANQVNEGDFANMKLGFNLALVDQAQLQTPVYEIQSQQKVGVITITNNGEGETTARMDFVSDPNDPNGQFQYEPDELQELTVEFEGEFRAAKTEASNPPQDNEYLQIVNQKIDLPKKAVEEKVTLNKSGKQNADGTISWTVTAQRKLDGQDADLENFILKDDLSTVGEPVADSLTLNGQPLDSTGVYDAASKQLTYTFPVGAVGLQTLSFKTKIDWAGKAETTVKNKAVLENPNGDPQEKEIDVPVSRKVPISKNFKQVVLDIDNNEKAFLWTIETGRKGFNYGPAWIADITMGKPGIPAPKRVELTVEKQLADGSWGEAVTLDQSKVTAADRPAVPAEGAACPAIPADYTTSEIYDFGKDFHQPTSEAPDGMEVSQSNWYFFPELSGVWRLTMKQVFAADQEIPSGALSNQAEIHICGSYNAPIKPPIYSGAASITKSTTKNSNADDFRQGLLPWNLSVNLTTVFPDQNTFAYDFFFYGSKDDYEKIKNELQVDASAQLPEGTFDAMRQLLEKGNNHDYKNPYVNFNLAYADGSLDSKDGLVAKTIPVMHNGKQVGDLVQISGFKEPKSYSFSLKGQMQNLYELTNGKSGFSTPQIPNTAVLATGQGPTLKTLSATDYYKFDASLFKKTALERDLNLADTGSVSKKKEPSNSFYQFYMEWVKNVDPAKVFNYKDRTAYFRLDVNILGTDWNKYYANLKKPLDPKPNYSKLTLADTLPEGWTLVPVDDENNFFALYEATPAHYVSIDYSIGYGGSDRQARYFYDATASKRLSTAEAHQLVSFNPESKEWTFNNYNSKPYMIVFKAQLDEATFNKLAEETGQKDPAKTYTNTARVTVENAKDTVVADNVNVKPLLLEKEKPVWASAGITDTAALTWTIHHRPYHKDYKGAVLKDVLDENLSLPVNAQGQPKLDSIKASASAELQADGSYANYQEKGLVLDGKGADPTAVRVSYDAAKHELTFKLPDNPPGAQPQAWKISYKTLLEPSNIDAEGIVNTLKLKVNEQTIPAEGFWEESLGKSVAWANLKKFPLYVFQKQGPNGTPDHLPGACFELWQGDKLLVTKTTNAKGQLYLVNLEDGDYVLKETAAPEGYKQRVDEVKFSIENKQLVLSSDNLADITGEGSRSNPVLILNQPAPPETTTTTTQPTGTTPSAPGSSQTTGPTKPGETTPTCETTPGQPGGGTTPSCGTKPSPGTTPSGKNPLVKTGQKANHIGFVILALAAVTAVVYLGKKNKSETE